MSRSFFIIDMEPADWARVQAIYADGLATGIAAFMRKPPLWKAWNAGHLATGRLVARRDDAVLGWAALASVADS